MIKPLVTLTVSITEMQTGHGSTGVVVVIIVVVVVGVVVVVVVVVDMMAVAMLGVAVVTWQPLGIWVVPPGLGPTHSPIS